MKTTIYTAPAPPGTEVVTASPLGLVARLQLHFPSRYSAVGIQLDADDLGLLRSWGLPVTGDSNAAAWRFLASEIERHGAIRVWSHSTYKEEM